uniref:CC-NBS-LRR resistance-like protein n=1 Tax=Pinus lambertiana TaxID=3343 RepID=Q1L6F3_PINLA|nr:CC-NBS-LRR resistance-like protein [Pinus lambertiana]
MKGVELLKKWEGTSCFKFFHSLRYGFQIRQLEGEISDFLRYQMPVNIFLEVKNLIAELTNLRQQYELGSMDESKMNETIFKHVSKLTNDPQQNAIILNQMGADNMFDGALVEVPCNHVGLGMSDFAVGLEKNIWNLKRALLQSEVTVVGVHGMGGLGKTTLALALSNDKDIKDVFQNNIIFITVSESPNLKVILETMWEKIVRRKRPEFQNVEEAHRQLQQQLLRQAKPTLVILDDVWSRANLEKLLFEGVGYKTLVTTRDRSTIPKMTSTQLYELPLLDDGDALSLFCFWAFGQKSIPSTANEHLVKQVQAQCKGLPLALKVIGSSLHGEPWPVWESAKKKLLNGESISDYHKEGLFKCLETSIGVLDEEARECFLDLGSFPEDRKISVDALLDIWVYVRKIEWQDAFVILLELASRNLLNLTSNLRSQAINYGSASELYFSQHDVMRALALDMASRDRIFCRKRLFMPRKEESLPGKWELFKDQAFDAQIVSIHTGTMEEDQWCKMNFCEAEALVLLFSATNYFLPSFLSKMRKLKVLIVFNYGSKRATVKGLPLLSSLAQLKTIRLERLVVPPLQEHSKVLQKLEKVSLSLCEGLGNMSRFNGNQSNLKLPVMLDFNMDHCCDLEELPLGICDMSSAQKWSITNCHLLRKLPDDLGRLSSLRMLRISACLGLKELPASIGKLGKLEYMDISLCECLKELPEEIGQLKKLEELDMRECARLRKLPKSVGGLKSLKHVICDEKIGQQWNRLKSFSATMDLRVEIVEAHFSLDWLDG